MTFYAAAFSAGFYGGVEWDAPPAPSLSRITRAPWSASLDATAEIVAPFATSTATDAATQALFGAAAPLDVDRVGVWSLSATADQAITARHGGPMTPLAETTALPFGQSSRADAAGRLPWERYGHHLADSLHAVVAVAHPADIERDANWIWATPGGFGPGFDVGGFAVWYPVIRFADRGWLIAYGLADPGDREATLPWTRFGATLETGWGVVVDPNEPPVDEHGTIIVPIRGAYIVLNEVTLIRVSDNLALDALSLSVTLDADSWVCGFQASLPGAALDDVIGSAGSPVELEAAINGITFRLLAEKVGRDRSFGKSRITVSGRGIAAVLDAPYAPIVSLVSAPALTAQQAMLGAITVAGLPTGWTLDWQLTDWLIPAGLWAHQGTPMSAVTRIAEAAGGYIQADPTTKVLHVLPRYPVVPWSWAGEIPDIEIPSAVAVTEGIAWEDKPGYNAVYVSGGTNGVLGHVKRAGTAADIVAQMVTDDLITHADAARQRGTAILSETGRQARVSLSLPVLPETGIILPGQLVRYVDGATTRLGLARSVAVSAGLPKVRQTVEIETHV